MIDWSFIGSLEGERLSGYVPDTEGSKSGVTIAGGVDLSAWNRDMLAPLDSDLVDRLAPYFGLRGDDAIAALRARPLSITQAEADALDQFVHADALRRLGGDYFAATMKRFDQLPDVAQTVIASVAFQYGKLSKACPKFWACAVRQDWAMMQQELEHFGDRYPTRRKKEAAYLGALLGDAA